MHGFYKDYENNCNNQQGDIRESRSVYRVSGIVTEVTGVVVKIRLELGGG